LGRIAVFASANPGKLRELRALLPDWEIEPLAETLPEETGTTFYENAQAKAHFAAERKPRRWALGEDSGLEVYGLAGRPGIRSARYAAEQAGDEDNVRMLLAETAGLEGADRGARYVSELVCVSPDGREYRGRGTLEGRIAEGQRGTEGFGYDPVFVPEGAARTVAELGDSWKREHSHRARAVRALVQALGEVAPEL
jgi:XTP/dITP diphosphohydrolase